MGRAQVCMVGVRMILIEGLHNVTINTDQLFKTESEHACTFTDDAYGLINK